MDVMIRTLLKLLLLICVRVELSLGTMHCLVSRPGYGLVSEECPPNTVACRIRIDHNAVEFYQYSPLYDRNQFVCVLKNEYGSEQKSGCQQKRSGRIRCWCFGHSNCNTPETSKQLYTAFVGADEQHFQRVVEQIDFSDISFDKQQDMPPTNLSISVTSPNALVSITTTHTTKQWPAKKEVMKGVGALSEEKRRQGQKTASAHLSSNIPNTAGQLDSDAVHLQSMRYNGGRGEGARVVALPNAAPNTVNNALLSAALSKSTNEQNSSSSSAKSKNSSGAMLIHEQDRPSQGHLHRMHVQRVVEQQPNSSASSPTRTTTTKAPENSHKRKEKPAKPVKSEFDTKNQVHIIHVNARDEYEHIIGSQQFADILHKQKSDPKELSATSPSMTYDQQEELEGREEGENLMDEKSAATLDMIANTPSQHGADLRRRQRNGFDGTISAKNKASELEEESLEEYFDSAFYTSLAVTNRFCIFAAFISIFACFALY